MFKKMNDWIMETFVGKRESIRQQVSKFWKDESGAGTVEYAMIIAVVVVMIIAATAVMDTPLRDFFEAVIDKISDQSGV